MMKYLLTILLTVSAATSMGQRFSISGKAYSANKPVSFATISIKETGAGATADSLGNFTINDMARGSYTLRVTCIGYNISSKNITIKNTSLILNMELSVANQTLDEVVVSGVSKATLIRENPVAIISISSKIIEHNNEANIIDVLVKNAPGLNAVKTGPNISKPFIRGLGYNRVLTLYDGIRQEGQQWGDEHGIEVDAYNIERAEVIKGPASLMYGSDALAGVVSLFPYIPNKSDGKLHGKFISEYQSNNNLIGNGLRLDYSNTNFLFALRGSYRAAKNYRNSIDGRVYNTGFDEKNLSALAGFQNDKGFSNLNLTLYDNLQGIPDGSRDSLTGKFTKQVYEGNDDDIKNRPVVTDEALNAYKLSPLHQHIQHYRIYMQNHYQIGNGDVDVLIALQQNIRREFNHPSMPEQAGLYVRLNTLNYGFRYNAPKFKNIEATVGINGMLQNNKSLNATDFPIPDYNLFDAGAYVYAKWKYNEWTISGGIRYDMRKEEWKDFYLRTNSSNGFYEHVYLPDTSGAALQFPSFKKKFHGMSASIGATYAVSKTLSLKANIGRGYRAPNITELSSNGLDPGAHIIYLGNRNFNPEFSLQEDVGIEARCNNFSADVSVFNNNIQNYIYLSVLADASGNVFTDAQGNKTYLYQQAAAQLYGMEAWLSLHPEKLQGFSFDNSFSVVYGFNKNSAYNQKGENGEYLPLIPPLKLLSSITQNVNIKSKHFASFTPKIELEYAAKQNHYLGLNNTESSTPSYALCNVSMASEIKYSKQTILLQLQVNNLFNNTYQSNLSRLKYFEYYNQSPNGASGIYNMGRNICIKAILTF